MLVSRDFVCAAPFASVDAAEGCWLPWAMRLVEGGVVAACQKLLVLVNSHDRILVECEDPIVYTNSRRIYILGLRCR